MTNKYLLGAVALFVSLVIHVAITYLWPTMAVQKLASHSQAPSVPMLASSFSDLVNENTLVQPVAYKKLTPTPVTKTPTAAPVKVSTIKPIVTTATRTQTLKPTHTEATKPLQPVVTNTAIKPTPTVTTATPQPQRTTAVAPKVKATVPALKKSSPVVKTTENTASTPLIEEVAKPLAQPVKQAPSKPVAKVVNKKATEVVVAAIITPSESMKPLTAQATTTPTESTEQTAEPVAKPTIAEIKLTPVPSPDAGQQAITQPASPAVPELSEQAKGYTKLVNQHIANTPRRPVRGKGTVVIEFELNASGQIVYATIATSSGRSRIDKAALKHLRRAAPFPPPPARAIRKFTLPFSFR